MIDITFPDGRSSKFHENEFYKYENEMEHIAKNIILNVNDPSSSFIYETDWRGEITNNEYISYQVL